MPFLRKYYLEKIKMFCLMDDIFMSKFFEDKACENFLGKLFCKKN